MINKRNIIIYLYDDIFPQTTYDMYIVGISRELFSSFLSGFSLALSGLLSDQRLPFVRMQWLPLGRFPLPAGFLLCFLRGCCSGDLGGGWRRAAGSLSCSPTRLGCFSFRLLPPLSRLPGGLLLLLPDSPEVLPVVEDAGLAGWSPVPALTLAPTEGATGGGVAPSQLEDVHFRQEEDAGQGEFSCSRHHSGHLHCSSGRPEREL